MWKQNSFSLRVSSLFSVALCLSQWESADAVRTGQLEDVRDGNASLPSTLKIDAYWLRHGLSCANIHNLQRDSKDLGWYNRLWGGLSMAVYQDPSLTDCAISKAHRLGPIIREKIIEDHPRWEGEKILVFSSAMVRAMETALHNFPDDDVFPIPHIAEEGITADNIPLAWEEQMQKKLARGGNTKEILDRLRVLEDVNPSDHPDRSNLLHKSSYASFLDNFAKYILILFRKHGLIPHDLLSESIPVVIVSHSGYMRNNLECFDDDTPKVKAKNNQIWLKKYTVDVEAEKLEPQPGCDREVLDPAIFEPKTDAICGYMVERCGHKPKELLKKYEKQCATEHPAC
eukprot:TRINITY_DN30539_c0_g1_i1.p1 TRINITY_DN30539_c0_g1~~TRINITY_DN30539_c0_g1_i1.p1  ORF type:complete len:343 (+),score=35.88 TRINITY_DN30539_c0_g1_i1:212-1240(+)